MDHVEAVLVDLISVRCAPGPLLIELKAMGSASELGVSIPYGSKQDLAAAFTRLQKLQVPFGDSPSGWPPAAVFSQLRDEGLVHGSIATISWLAPEQPIMGAG